MIIHWFRRDLRLHDNSALAAAATDSGGAVAPVFMLDDRLLYGRFAGPARTRFLLESLHMLDEGLRAQGARLILRRGDPLYELLALARATGATAVYWNRDYSPFARVRDETVARALTEAGLVVRSFKDLVLQEPDELMTQAGKPYTVYTPYAKRWRTHLAEQGLVPELPTPPTLAANPELRTMLASLPTLPIPSLAELGMQTDQEALPGGERHAHELLARFTDLRHEYAIAGYKERRNMPALPATSRLSAHLHLGTISVRACLRAALLLPSTGADAWIGELIWRDFYIQALYHHPHVLRGAFKPQFDALKWQDDEALFAAWQAGRTGYPLVDAAMRQLNREAWMHNRARMIVASFLTKDLLLNWRWGERYFMQQLVDGDLAANNGGWQWAAGTGTDAQPFFRIFNPTSQGQKFDPQGAYVRRYLPELANVPDSFIHEPWKMSPALQHSSGVQIGIDYPAPIVDHALQRERALALYRAIR